VGGVTTRRLVVPSLRFDAVRAELKVPEEFPPEVVAEAEAAASAPRLPAKDATDIPFVTIDPPGSTDLDQAVHLARNGGGYRVSYAIADVAAFVVPGGALDQEARRRGLTRYSPDERTPLHPAVLSEGAASLLPGQPRPAALWTIDLDADGEPTQVRCERAMVTSRAKLGYPQVQQSFDSGQPPEAIAHLRAVGELRAARARARHATELDLPDQEVTRAAGGGWTVAFRNQLPVERWNAEISLLTGICAATVMLAGDVGLLRTMPPPNPKDVAHLRRIAPALGVSWPDGAAPGDVISAVSGSGDPRHAAFLEQAVRLLRGAGYTAFAGDPPVQPAQSAVAAPYAHVTAPLRRLADRFATEICLALLAGTTPPSWATVGLPALPELMADADRRANELERACVDLIEAWLLAGREGSVYDAVVVESGAEHGTVVLADPAVRAPCDGGGLPLGERLRVRLTEADPAARRVRFAPAT
jgi:exoribonuclease R